MPTSATRQLELRVLGPAQVWLRGAEVRLPIKKTLALLAYLALEGTSSRSRLAGLFWSEQDEGSARRNLRRELHRLREAGLEGYLGGDEQIWLEHTQTDVAEFERALEEGRFEPALAMYRGTLLEGLELPGAEGFGEWLEHRRQRLSEQWHRAMLYHAEALETRGHWHQALEIHLKLLAQDNLQERHHREVMRLFYLLGDREAALRQFERCQSVLQSELGLSPLPQTLELAQRIRSTQGLEPLAVFPAPPVGKLSLPLVGREAELSRLLGDSAPLTLVLGEPGVGKTRLVQEAYPQALVLRFSEVSQQTPLYGVAEGIRGALAKSGAAWEGLEPVWQQEVRRLLPELPAQEADSPQPPQERVRFLEGLTRLLLALAQGRGLLLDDLHWADPSSLELLAHLLRRAAQTPGSPRIGATARPQELSENPLAQQVLEDLQQQGWLLRLSLAPLDQAQVRGLVRQMSGGEAPLFSGRLFRATAGNPFFILETLRYLFEGGELRLAPGGGWSTPYDDTTQDYRELPIPPSVRQAVLERVDRLGAAARRLLEAASLAQDGFSLEEIGPATALSEWEGLEGLEQAVKAQVLERWGTGYRFGHDLTRSALEGSLSPERRRLIHLKLAANLERLGAPPARIAAHLEQAGKPKEAIPWRLEAGQQAERVYAHPEALEHYGKALEDGLAGHQAIQVRLQRADILAKTHQYERHRSELEQASDSAAALGDPELQAQILVKQASALHNTGQLHPAIEVVKQGLRLSPISDRTRGRLLGISGAAYLFAGELDLAEQDLNQGLGYAHQDPLAGSSMHSNLCRIALQKGHLEAAERHIQQTISLAAEAKHEGMQITALSTAAQLATSRGDTARATEQLEQAVQMARKINHTHMLVYCLHELAKLYIRQGELEAARLALEEGQSLTDPSALVFIAEYHDALGNIHRWQGRLGLALELYQKTLWLVDQVGEQPNRRHIRLQLAQFYLLLGSPGLAQQPLAFIELGGETDAELEASLALCELAEEQVVPALQREPRLRQAMAPDAPLTRYTLASLCLASGRFEQVLDYGSAPREPSTWEAGLLALRLRAAQALGKPEPALAEAERFLASRQAYPLETLELRRALAQAYQASGQARKAKRLYREAAQMVRELAATLADYPQLERAFLHKNRDLLG